MVSFVFMLVTFILVGGILGDLYVKYDGHLWSNMKISYKICNGMVVDSLILLGAGPLAIWFGARMAQERLEKSASAADNVDGDDSDDDEWTLPVSVAERYELRKTVLDNDEPAEKGDQS